MLQITSYLVSFFMVVKGIEVLQIGLASNRERRGLMITIGVLTLLASVAAAAGLLKIQHDLVAVFSQSIGNNPPL